MERQKVVYVAESPQEARTLQQVLDDQGIKAVVSNEALQGGLGGGFGGWSMAARVVVDERDAEAARQIVLNVQRQNRLSADGSDRSDGVQSPVVLQAWPQCPECSAPRPVQCPICKTIGTDFGEADADYTFAVDGAAADDSASCGCGAGSCSVAGGAADAQGNADSGDEPVENRAQDEEAPPAMIICPTCDEPFEPNYSRYCAWCEHDFGEGFEVDIQTLPAEDWNPRTVAMILTLVGLFVLVLVYLSLLV